MTIASLNVSIDRNVLKNMHSMGAFDTIAPGVEQADLSSDQVEKYVGSIVARTDDNEVYPNVIKSALKRLQVPIEIADQKARMFQFCSDIFPRLDGVGYGDFKTKHPEKTIKMIQSHLYSQHLKDAMAQHLEFQGRLKNS